MTYSVILVPLYMFTARMLDLVKLKFKEMGMLAETPPMIICFKCDDVRADPLKESNVLTIQVGADGSISDEEDKKLQAGLEVAGINEPGESKNAGCAVLTGGTIIQHWAILGTRWLRPDWLTTIDVYHLDVDKLIQLKS